MDDLRSSYVSKLKELLSENKDKNEVIENNGN